MLGSDELCSIRMRLGPVPCAGDKLIAGVGGASTSFTITSGGVWYFKSVGGALCCPHSGATLKTARPKNTMQRRSMGMQHSLRRFVWIVRLRRVRLELEYTNPIRLPSASPHHPLPSTRAPKRDTLRTHRQAHRRFPMPSKALALSAAFLALAFPAFAQTRRLSADDMPKVVRISDPQISPDGKTIAITVGRANLKEDRYDTEIDFVDIAPKSLRVMTHDRHGISSVRWSADGASIAYLADDADKKAQIFIMPMAGGDSRQLTHSKTSIKLIAWNPDGKQLAYAAPDEEPEKKDEAKFDDAFEVGNNGYLERSRAMPIHLWLVELASGESKRLTSGEWSLPNHFAPAAPPSQIAFTPDGKSIVFVKADSPLSGDTDSSRLAIVDVASGTPHRLTSGLAEESSPILSPDGAHIAYTFPRDGQTHNEDSQFVVPIAGGNGTDVAHTLDRAISGAAWMPGNNALLLAGNDEARGALWLQPIGGKASRIDVGALSPSAAVNVGKDGAIAFTATGNSHAAELFYLAHIGDAPIQLTHLQTVTDGVALAKPETVHWKSDSFDVDGVLTYPPDYTAGKKYPLVLYLHGGPTGTSLETFSMPAQIFAGQGWLVFEPNYRGQQQRGQRLPNRH